MAKFPAIVTISLEDHDRLRGKVKDLEEIKKLFCSSDMPERIDHNLNRLKSDLENPAAETRDKYSTQDKIDNLVKLLYLIAKK